MMYFDHSATTPIDPKVQALVNEINELHFGNPSSIHRYGQKARALIEKSRKQVASLIGCRASEIIFTGSGTEANNTILWNRAFSQRRHVILSSIEHPSLLTTVKKLRKLNVEYTLIAPDQFGIIDPDDITKAIKQDTGLISVMTANNEIGSVQPITEICRIAQQNNIPFHTDAVQVVGKLPLNVNKPAVDLMTISSHKFYGPKGVGALFRRQGYSLQPLIMGGGQEQKLRSGTENVAGIAGMGLAAELANKNLKTSKLLLEKLEKRFVTSLQSHDFIFKINGHTKNHIPGLISLTIPAVSADVLIVSLDMAGMAVSNGSACSSGTVQSSHVLEAMGLKPEANRCTIRISFGRDNTVAEVEQLADKLVEIATIAKNR